MRARTAVWMAVLTCTLAASCASRHGQASSGSNWLSCDEVTDCDVAGAVACEQGYCVDADGRRILATDPVGVEGPAPDGGPGRDAEPGAGGSAARDGGHDAGGPDAGVGFTERQYEGVWVFEYAPDLYLAALMTGVARIENGCLYVNDTVVVWDASRGADAEQAITLVQQGLDLEVTLGGGTWPVGDEPVFEPVRSAVNERCPGTVFFAADEPVGFRELTDAGTGGSDGGFRSPCDVFLDGTDSCADGWECRPESDVVDLGGSGFLCTRRCQRVEECPLVPNDHCGELRKCFNGFCGLYLCD